MSLFDASERDAQAHRANKGDHADHHQEHVQQDDNLGGEAKGPGNAMQRPIGQAEEQHKYEQGQQHGSSTPAEVQELIPLPGLTCPEPVLRLALDLERRGLLLMVREGKLIVRHPAGGTPELTPEDTAAITRWKPHLCALVDWVSSMT